MTNIHLTVTASYPPSPIIPPSPLGFILHDDASADAPRKQFAPEGFLPRTYRDKHNPSLPETTKYNSHTMGMTRDWGQLEYDLIYHYAPAHMRTEPAKGILPEIHLNGYVVKNRIEEIYLRLAGGSLYKSNGTGWNDLGFYDPLTGVGDTSGKPWRREDLTCCGNVYWSAGGNKAWALDALAPAPKASQIWDKPWLVHASTACYGRVPADWPEGYDDCIDKAKTATHPNGIWRVTPFGDLEGNVVPLIFVSANPNSPTMVHDGIAYRQITIEATRASMLNGPIPSPYQR